MKIIPIVPRGYCKGVVHAINLAKDTRANYPNDRITMLGMIVHNQYIIDACKNIGIECVEEKGKTRLELLDKINEGIVIFTAHGVSDQVTKKALEKGLTIVDASCSDVSRTKVIVQSYLDQQYDVLYIGKKFHPEAEAITSLSSNVHLITSTEDIDSLPNFSKVVVTNQTTMSILETQDLIYYAQKRYPELIVVEEICQATRVRQEAIQKLEPVDCLIVVGDPNSNNTKKLKEIAEKNHISKVFLVQTANDLNPSWFDGVDVVAVTSGASTPTFLTNQVLESLEVFNQTKQFPETTIDFSNLL